MALKRQLWIVCVLPLFGRTIEAVGAREKNRPWHLFNGFVDKEAIVIA